MVVVTSQGAPLSLDYLRNQVKKAAELSYCGWHFLQLKGVGGKPVLSSTHKGGPWLKVMGNSTTSTSQATHMITGHAPIGEYRHCFSLNGEYQCWCLGPEIQTRDHLLCIAIVSLSMGSTNVGALVPRFKLGIICYASAPRWITMKLVQAQTLLKASTNFWTLTLQALGSFTPLAWDPG
ncbi:hypothetical protein L208DRAFT_1510151 [Tricholoma matsutake]|nr:hypothetical protein L208DRAFT_1510151 [Tricholoma matsutake 945]